MKKLMVVIGLLWAVSASAEEIKIANGSSSGIYDQITKEIQQQLVASGSDLVLTSVASSGAIENLDKLIGNEAGLAFMHSDVLFYRSKIDDLTNLKTLLALFPEDVNIIALNQPYKPESKFKMVNLNRGINLETISDLEGLPVGAAGGGYVTANVIRLQSEIGYKVIRFDKGSQVLDALKNGQIAAAIFVGPAPLPNLSNLDGNYKLLSINDSVADKLKSVYKKSSITYIKINPNPVQTVAADDLLVTRNYKSKKMIDALLKLRKAVQDNINDLQETTGFHKAWQKVDINNQGKWDWYNPQGDSNVKTS